MEHNIIKQLKKLSAIKLSTEEKARVRRSLENFTGALPSTQLPHRSVPSPYLTPSRFKRFFTAPAKVSALVLVLLIGSGISVVGAASAALPGESLYNFKVNGIEEIQSLIRSKPAAKAEFEIKRTEERIREATKLTLKQKMTNETSTIIQTQIEKHTERAQAETKKVEEESPSAARELNAQLESSLITHSAALSIVQDQTDADGEVTRILETTTEKATEATIKVQDLAVSISEEPSTQSTKDLVEQALEDLQRALENIQNTINNPRLPLSKNLADTLDAEIGTIIALYDQAFGYAENQAYGLALITAQDALQRIQELRTVLDLSESFDLSEDEQLIVLTPTESEEPIEEDPVNGEEDPLENTSTTDDELDNPTSTDTEIETED